MIFEEADLETLEGPAHDSAIEYLALRTSMRDREQLSQIICRSQPDLITQAVREGITAYDPIFRSIHNAVDLSQTCTDLEEYLRDFMGLFEKPHVKNGTRTPKATQESQLRKSDVTVEEIADVLRKHQGSLHRFLHQMANNGGEITEEYRTYVKDAAANFKTTRPTSSTADQPGAGEMAPHLNKLVESLPAAKRTAVLDAVDLYAGYLMALSSVTEDRMRGVLMDGTSPRAGPGAFLARWQRLLDTTATTPITPIGPVRYGSARVHEVGGDEDEMPQEQWLWPEVPDVSVVTNALATPFKKLLGELVREYWKQHVPDESDPE